MAQKISKEMIDARADELRALCERIGTLNDADRIVAEARVAQRKAEELQAMTIVHSQQLQEEWAAQVPHEEPVQLIKVKLTEEQRKAVHAQTGVWLDVVPFREGRDFHPKLMPHEHPELVTARSIDYAMRQRRAAEADAEARVAFAESIQALRAQNNPELNAMLDKQLADPNSLGGYFGPPKKGK